MASLTVRRLDDTIKEALRVRAAQNQRSLEEEVRAILTATSGLPSPGKGPFTGQHSYKPEAPSVVSASPAATPAPDIRDEGTDRGRGLAGDSRPHVLLIIGGGIAAYKALDLIRRLRERGLFVRTVLTRAAQHFVTPLAASALSDAPCATDLFDPRSEFDASHIRLARQSDLIIVAPATADLIAKMAHGLADDLASAILAARRAPLLIAPAMNPAMWDNAATRRNVAQLVADGVALIGPEHGEMAEAGEAGLGRMAEPVAIADAARARLTPAAAGDLAGKRVLVTAGPTHEPIDPVRYIANRSSGKQGFAIASAARDAGAAVTLIAGPVTLPDPPGITVVRVESARAMREAVSAALPVDVAIFAAAVADWRVAGDHTQKIKKVAGALPQLALEENPDILAGVARATADRPALVIGFAAETENVVAHATEKRARKGCDWIVANDVSPATGIMGGDRNTIHLVTATGVEDWPPMSKADVARELVRRIAQSERLSS